MLKPGDRSHLFELLRPPVGFHLDQAVGTTFSLDLLSLLTLPLSFALLDAADESGRPPADPLALLEALRRYSDRMTVFCQAAQIRLPSNYPRLLTWLEPSIVEVLPHNAAGVFHPKVWALRFVTDDQPVRYRILCLTRNLTFDRCWDAAVVLDGELTARERAFAANHPLGDFIAELPRLGQRPVAPERWETIKRMAEELRRVKFELPEGFESYAFWHGGIDPRLHQPFSDRSEQSLIVAPFVSDEIVQGFAQRGRTHLVSRLETLQALQPATVQACRQVLYLAPEIETEEAADDGRQAEPGEVLDGLHAKLYVIDRGRDTSIFIGSFNATAAAFRHNVEFMVELVGKKSHFGVSKFLEPVKGEMKFVDLLQPFTPADETANTSAVVEQLETLLYEAKRTLAAGNPKVIVTPAENETFEVALQFRRQLSLPCVTGRCWPLSLPLDAGKPVGTRVVFERVSYEGLTPMFAFELRARVEDTERVSTFVMNLTMEGAPEDRRERALASLLENKEKLLRYILFMLSAGDEGSGSAGDLLDLLNDKRAGSDGRSSAAEPCLLEALLMALHRDPRQLARVATLLDDLRKAPDGSALLSPEFQRIWEPVWETARKIAPLPVKTGKK